MGLGEQNKGVVMIAPHRATWRWMSHYVDDSHERKPQEVKVTRYQFPLLPERVRTVQTAQGMGMDAATMELQKLLRMSHDDWWLHLYVMLSRVRVAHRLLVYNLPPWDILQRGPPAYVREGVRRFEEKKFFQSFALAKQRAQEYKWDVGDGPTAPSGAAGAGAAAPRGEGVAPESSSAPAPPTVPPASPLGLPRAAGSSAGVGEEAGDDDDDAAGSAPSDGEAAPAASVQTPLPSRALRPGQALP